MRDLDEHAAKRMDLVQHANSIPVHVPDTPRQHPSRSAAIIALDESQVTPAFALTASILNGVCNPSHDIDEDLDDIRRQYQHGGQPRTNGGGKFRPAPPKSPTTTRQGTPRRETRSDDQAWASITRDTSLSRGRKVVMPAEKARRELAGKRGLEATFGGGGYQTITAAAKMKAVLTAKNNERGKGSSPRMRPQSR